MSAPARRGTGPLARGLALLVAAGCFGAIAWSAREPEPAPARPAARLERPPLAAAASPPRPAGAADACLEQKQKEAAALLAQGELTAERRMRLRQIEARACE